MKNLGDDFCPSPAVDASSLPVACRWLLSRLSATATAVNAAMEAYDFGTAAQASTAYGSSDLRLAVLLLGSQVLAVDMGSEVLIPTYAQKDPMQC